MKLIKELKELNEDALLEQGFANHIQMLAEEAGMSTEQFLEEQEKSMTTVHSVDELFAAIGWSKTND
jgi:predicted ATPase